VRARQFADAAPWGSRDHAEACLAEAEIYLWRGRFADADRSLDAAALASDAVEDGMTRRRRLLCAQLDMARGELRGAAKWLSRAQNRADRLRAEVSRRPDADEGSGTDDPSVFTARAAAARLDVLTAELTLIREELAPPAHYTLPDLGPPEPASRWAEGGPPPGCGHIRSRAASGPPR
jgi:hypothetical protein